jgi:hypothetical protein
MKNKQSEIERELKDSYEKALLQYANWAEAAERGFMDFALKQWARFTEELLSKERERMEEAIKEAYNLGYKHGSGKVDFGIGPMQVTPLSNDIELRGLKSKYLSNNKDNENTEEK